MVRSEGQGVLGREARESPARGCLPMPRRVPFPVGVFRFADPIDFSREKTGFSMIGEA